jgi:CRISPR-associated protein Cas1
MRKTNRSGRGTRRRSVGDDTQDLFAKQLTEVVQQAFAVAGSEAKPGETTTPQAAGAATSSTEDRVDLPPAVTSDAPGGVPQGRGYNEDGPHGKTDFSPSLESLPARMLNEFVYCPRLFYYEHVEGVFVESADTVRGATVHARVDKGSGAMPKARGAVESGEEEANPAADGDEIHSRSVMLGSERLGVVAKMDLVESTLDEAGNAATVCPVDYKVGSPREGEDGLELWDTDRMQLGLQCLLLRDNGYACEAGIIYYRGTKQRVRLDLTQELEAWVMARIAAARIVAKGPIPPPLVDSPKCARCSLAPVCLPDETRMLSIPTVENRVQPDGPPGCPAPSGDNSAPDEVCGDTNQSPGAPQPRRLIAPRDEKRALYLNTQGFRVGCNDAVIKVKDKDRLVEEVRVSDVCHVAIFGNIQMSTQAVQRLCDCDIPVTWFSMGGWFYGMTRGHSLTNVLLRIEQFRQAADPSSCLRLARQFVRGKIHNHRVLFMRNHLEPPERTKLRLGQAREDAVAARSLEELLGVEGAAAAVYFHQFGGLIREQVDDDFLEGIVPAPSSPPPPRFSFDFTTRNRRPPTDPVNALLSLAYSMLAKECTLAACAVGFDPYVGFYHQPRHGRPALALDIMEEFRPLIAESAVLTAINNRFVSTNDFVAAGRAVNLSPAGRKQFFQCFEQRMNSLITHPIFDYKVSYRRAVELQFRILARVLTGEIPEYIPFMTR